MLKKGTTNCPADKATLEFRIGYGMNLVRQITPEKPKRPYYVYDARCPLCFESYEIKK